MKTSFPLLPTILLAVIVFLSTLSGCATVDQKIGLNYAPAENSFGRRDGEIFVSRTEATPSVRNSRGEWIVGSLNNVHGVHQADLLADRSLGDWITDALTLELKKAGYRVIYKPEMPGEAPLGIQLNILKADMNSNKGLFSTDTRQELKFSVDLYLRGVKAKTFTVASRTNQTFALTASKEEQEKIMLQTLQDAMLQISPEFNALIDKK